VTVWWLLSLVVLLIALISSAPASAAPYEPNDSFAAANGPLIGGQTYSAAIETSNDVDWFFFNTTGQRQLDIALTATTPNCAVNMSMYDVDGDPVRGSYSDLATSSNYYSGVQRTGHITYTAEFSQYALKVTGPQGCGYDVVPTPADAYTSTTRGLQFSTSTYRDSDAIYRVSVDGRQLLNASSDGSFVLGQLPPTSRITYEVQNTLKDWGWDAGLTNIAGRGRTTLWIEDQAGSTVGRIGVVRRVVLSPSGNILESCGEALTAAPCFPRDSDGDGVSDDVDKCPTTKGSASAGGCPDADGDGIPDSADKCPNTPGPASAAGCPDADGDGIPDSVDRCKTVPGPAPSGCPEQAKYATLVTVKRSGRRFSGRVSSSGPGCASARHVVLRRVGNGTRAFAATTARPDGTFTIVAPPRMRGPFYVLVSARNLKTKLCRSASSRFVR
jgi:hypothetical protein